jgi:hypothetical protein
MNFLSEMNDRKESEEGRMLIQNKIVSSQNCRSKKRRGRHCSGVSPTFSHSAGRATAFVGQNGQSTEKSPNMGNTHKIPEKTNCRRDRDF